LESSVPEAVRASPVPRARFYYGYVIVLCSFFILLVVLGTHYSFGIFFTPLLQEFGWSRTAVSITYSIATLVSGSFSILAGKLTDSYGPRWVVLGGGLVLSLGCLLMYFAHALWQIYIFVGLCVGLGFGASFTPLLSTVSRWFTQQRGLMTGIVVAGVSCGTILFPFLINRFISAYSWRLAFVFVGLTVLAVIVPASLFLKRDPSRIGMPAQGEKADLAARNIVREKGTTLKESAHTVRFWVICSIYVLHGFCLQGVMAHIVPHAVNLGISAGSAATILSCMGLGSLVGRIIMSSFSDRMGTRPSLIFNLSVMLIAVVWLPLAGEVWMLYLSAAVFGFGYGGMVGLQALISATEFGLASLGILVGIISFSVTAGGAIGPMVTGYIFDVTGSYRLAFIIYIALSLITVGLAVSLRKSPRKVRV
jgi:MFS family permease